ncbi:MAG TPA: hypothetical protein VEU29_05445 [Actinomycetota bacterium]|nr:hypothetical protein [Actinomycetota bacterium]
MRRGLTFLLLAAVMATAAPAATAARPKGAGSRTFYVVPGADEDQCSLSSSQKRLDPNHGCGTRDNAATGMVLGAEPAWLPAVDGLPLRIDVTRPIQGEITVSSRYLIGYYVVTGAGQAQLEVTVAGTVGGQEVTVGTVTSEAYPVTPDRAEYRVEFRIEPDAALAGATLTGLRLGLEVVGPNVNHNLYYADGKSAVTVPLAR